eukprot:TRINITY_DN8905_c0_g1_i1.p2 TRINITY_DN8905_c0_g1~~TRINITY_DN8905_c0_g1_i1.p2  ORF type:complete len:330 (-),score=56.23 TRINITY_DN8905_c0_g1_i1:361-1350(-)
MGQGAAQGVVATRFYFYGKKHFTETGWKLNSSAYKSPDLLNTVDLKGRCFVITGANSGIGRETTEFLASRGGKVYMVCRNAERAEKERQAILEKTKNQNVHVVIGDCGLAADVRRIVSEIKEKEQSVSCLMCNAGALSNTRTTTADGIETTFATHLLCGTYLLTEEFRPLLEKAEDPRVVVMSSGGMYNVRYDHERAVGSRGRYDGQLAYAYAKRGQVILCDRWAKAGVDDSIAYVSVHPGWTDTPGVDAAYGSQKKYLQPMRSLWQGAEGACWLCVAPGSELQSGAFYLDRTPQPTQLPGWLFGNFTRNTPEEEQALLPALQGMASKL